MDVRFNISPSFGCLIGSSLIEKDPELLTAKKELQGCKHWHVIADDSGEFKLHSSDTKRVYELADKPKRHAPSALFIRTYDKTHKVKGKITSFRIDLPSMEEARNLYKQIIKATGIDRMVLVAKVLEKQAIKRTLRRRGIIA